MEELHELAPLRRRAPRTETKSSVERPVTARAPGHVRSVCPLKASNETKHGPPGRAVRRAAASSVAPIALLLVAPCVLASHSPIAPSQRVIIPLEALRGGGRDLAERLPEHGVFFRCSDRDADRVGRAERVQRP